MDTFRSIDFTSIQPEVHDSPTPTTDLPVNNQEEPTQPLNLCIIA
jgi:hypothetical protein